MLARKHREIGEEANMRIPMSSLTPANWTATRESLNKHFPDTRDARSRLSLPRAFGLCNVMQFVYCMPSCATEWAPHFSADAESTEIAMLLATDTQRYSLDHTSLLSVALRPCSRI